MSNNKFLSRFAAVAFAAIASFGATSTFGAIPSGYYSSCEGKSGQALLTALYQKISSHTNVGYGGLYNVYAKSDIDENGKIWDIYSTKRWNVSGPRCGNYSAVGDCYNREHTVPQSWFNEAAPMKSDAFHVYPTDGKVNGQRSNYPYGECSAGETLPSKNGVDALGRLGACTFSGYSGKVFEPDDRYKGDIARTYFYMAACYNDKISSWSGASLAGNKFPVFSTWTLNLLLKWHRQDPVDDKEIDRNDAIYGFQKNRNPFIDHPELVEYIWGTKNTTPWTEGAGLDPEIVLPVDGSRLNIGAVGVNATRTTTVTVKGSGLSDAVSVSVSGAPFSVTPTTISAANANSSNGATVTLSCKATAAGAVSGTLYVKSGSLTSTVQLSATAYDGLPASAPTNISDVSFVAHWTNIGDVDANGCYTLYVLDENGDVYDTYPRSVKAADEAYTVDELSPSTKYSYYLTTASGIKSNTINVTTVEPIPSIQLLYDGELEISANPGEPSDAYEILLDVENITDDITLKVVAPFELSSDKATWGLSLTVAPSEDRFFLRINSDKVGVYTSTIVATAGDYMTDDAEVSATVADKISFLEDFEKGSGGSGYNTDGATITATMGDWYVFKTGLYTSASEAHGGSNYIRTNKDEGASYAYTLTPKKSGAGIITFYAAPWSTSEAGVLEVLTSIDNGQSWQSAGEVNVTSATAQEYKKYTVTANVAGSVQIKLAQKSGKRLMIDDIEIGDFYGGIEGVESDYRSWTAYSAAGQLVVELSHDANVAVHGVDGITYFNDEMHGGNNTLNLAPGLYIVVVDDFARRVLVK